MRVGQQCAGTCLRDNGGWWGICLHARMLGNHQQHMEGSLAPIPLATRPELVQDSRMENNQSKYAALSQLGSLRGNFLQDATALPKEPNMRQKCEEIRGYLMQAHENVAEIRGVLFGEGECAMNEPTPVQSPMERTIAELCELAANLVGATATIKNRL